MIDESMDTEQMNAPAEPWEFRSKPAWQRLIIMLGGIIVNVILAWLIFTIMYSTVGQKFISTAKIQENGLAFGEVGQKAGFRNGDKILSVDGKYQPSFNRMTLDVLLGDKVVVERNGAKVDVLLTDEMKGEIISKEGKEFAGPRFSNTVVDSVVPKSAANLAGLQKGDKIKDPVTEQEQLAYSPETKTILKVKKYLGSKLDLINQTNTWYELWAKAGATPNYVIADRDNYIKYLNSLEKILGFDGNGKNTLDDAVIDNNLSVAEEYYKYLNALAQEEQDTFSSSTNGFIPFNLGVTMDGISGIKIYNKLNVSTRFLPQNYPDALHFIIKGVSHKISNQDWETTLETTVVPNSFIDPSKIIPRPQITTTTSTSEETTGAAGAAGVAAASTTSTINTAVVGVVDDNRRFWTLVAICSREDNNPQGYADVAQSIYNRNLGGRSIGYRSDIVDQILANSQYEPTWRFPVFRTEYKANIEWFNIKDIQTASIATGLPISTLQKVVEALKNPTLQQNARSFIKGRTDFLGSNQPASRMKQKIQRNSTNNKFGFNWGWNPANGGNAAPIPSYVTNINV
jgi:hypothetical protein